MNRYEKLIDIVFDTEAQEIKAQFHKNNMSSTEAIGVLETVKMKLLSKYEKGNKTLETTPKGMIKKEPRSFEPPPLQR